MSASPDQRHLRIGIDARGLLKQRTGVERMLYQFIDALAQVSPHIDFFLFLDAEPDPSLRRQWPHRFVVAPAAYGKLQKVFDFWLSLQLRSLLKKHEIDAFFSPHTKFPFAPLPRIVTVHGLEWSFYPEGYQLPERLKQWFWFMLSASCAQGIVTFADNTLSDIRKLKPRCRLPICVVPEGVDARFAKRKGLSLSSLQRFGINREFVLSVCSLDPRKNIPSLISAYARATVQMDNPPQLVLVGRSGWKSEDLRTLVDREGVTDRVVFAGYVTDEELVDLYSLAQIFVYPSLYEGFGLPVLEAMACGVPVITSKTSSLGEVGGRAALLIDPDSVADISAGIRQLLLNPDLRDEMRSKGFQHVKRYSWKTMTREICEFLETSVRDWNHGPENSGRAGAIMAESRADGEAA